MEKHKERDKNLASYLLTQTDLTYNGTETDERGIVYFIFSPADLAEKHISAYFAKSCPAIQPKILFDSQKEVLDAIHSAKRGSQIWR